MTPDRSARRAFHRPTKPKELHVERNELVQGALHTWDKEGRLVAEEWNKAYTTMCRSVQPISRSSSDVRRHCIVRRRPFHFHRLHPAANRCHTRCFRLRTTAVSDADGFSLRCSIPR